MKANKGFTLIELLAVIVILAIIALIATPIIVELIKNSRISAAENATHGILKAAEVYYGNQILENHGVFNENTTMKITFDTTEAGTTDGGFTLESFVNRIEYDGTQAKAGHITIDRYGDVVITKALRINNYFCAYKVGSSSQANNRLVRCSESDVAGGDIEIGTPGI